MAKLKREREGHSVKMKRLAGGGSPAQEGQRVEASAGRPMCGGGMWRRGAAREEGLRDELFKRQKKN